MKDKINIDSRIKELKLLPQTRAFVDTYESKSGKYFLVCVLILVLGAVFWACVAKMDDIVIGSAVLRPMDNISSLNILTSGEVVKKFYKHNDQVKAGDLLLMLDSSAEEVEINAIKSQLKNYEEELEEYDKLLSFIKSNSEYDNFSSSANPLLINNFVSEYKQLKLQYNNAKLKYEAELSKPEMIRIKSNVNELYRDYQFKEEQLGIWKNQQEIQIENTVRTHEEKIDSLKMRISALERAIKSMSIYSPIDGYVSESVQLNEGDYVLAGTDILKVIPLNSGSLKAQIMVDVSNIARIKEGQKVKLRFPGLPPAKFGQLEATVTLVPADLTISSNTPVFVLEAEINNPSLTSVDGNTVSLRSGLSAEARLIVDTDTALRMLLRKLDFVV